MNPLKRSIITQSNNCGNIHHHAYNNTLIQRTRVSIYVIMMRYIRCKTLQFFPPVLLSFYSKRYIIDIMYMITKLIEQSLKYKTITCITCVGIKWYMYRQKSYVRGDFKLLITYIQIIYHYSFIHRSKDDGPPTKSSQGVCSSSASTCALLAIVLREK